MRILYAQRTPPHQALECAERTSLALSDGQRRFVIYTTYLITLYFDFYKVVKAYTVGLHVNEHFEIDHMSNKTFMSFIQIISTTFDKNTCSREGTNSLRSLVRICTVEAGRSQQKFGSVYFTRFYDFHGAKETQL